MFQEVRPGAGFETRDFVKERLGGGYRSKTPAEVESLERVTLYLTENETTIGDLSSEA